MNKNKIVLESRKINFATTYTRDDYIKIFKKFLCLGLIFLTLMHFLIIPLIAKFSLNAHNVSFLGISGTTFLLIGIFVSLPLISAIILSPILKRAIKGLQQRQYPPEGLKVLKKTKIIKGRKAIAKSLIILLLYFIAIVPVTVLGYSSLNIMLNNRNNGK